jgi:hypothetical protein
VDKSRLEALRREVLGEEAAAYSQSDDERREKMQVMMDSLTPQEQTAAAMQMFLQMAGQRGGPTPPDLLKPENLPKEAAALQELLAQRMKALMEKAKGVVAEHPLNPEVLRLLEKSVRPPENPS